MAWDIWYHEDWEEKDQLHALWMNYEAVRKTVPAKPGLLKVADSRTILFPATKKDIVGPSLQSRNPLFTYVCCFTHALYSGTGSVD